MAKTLVNTFLILLYVLTFPFVAFPEEIYEYERMWPVLEQPWYFNNPCGIAIDSSGHVYVADSQNHRIQKFTSSGQFITKWGSSGSGNGQLNWPRGIALDSSGNVYVVDSQNHRIQKFTSSGQFVTKWGSEGSGDGQFNLPWGIALDSSGYVYVADTYNHRIQKFTSSGQFVTKWGSEGSGDGQLNLPWGIALDNSGNVYVVDSQNHRVQKFTSSGQFVTKWGSLGSGNGQFSFPGGIAVDSSGNVYVADTGNPGTYYYNHRIQKFTSSGQFVTKWGSPGFGDGQFNLPQGIALDSSGYVYVADTYSHRIQKFTSGGQFVTKWGSLGFGDGQFNRPQGIALDSSGNVYVVETWGQRIQKFTSGGQFVTKWGTYGNGDGQFSWPQGIAVDSSGNVYVADTQNHRIQKFTSDGQFVTKWGSEGSGDGQFNWPKGIAVDSSGNVYVADIQNQRIQKFRSNGQFVTKWESGGGRDSHSDWLEGIALDSSANVYVADTLNNRIQKFTSNGQFIINWGNFGSGDGQFKLPQGIALDSSGYVYVADDNHRIQKFTSSGQFVTKWGSLGSNAGEFSYPTGITMTSDGKVYVSDTGNQRIQVFSKVTGLSKNKAIIVAGSGPYKGNNLWEDIQKNANRAYHTLTYQGYTNDTIYYLSWDINIGLDLNGDGKCDVDADATNSNLQYAITEWAKDAESLVIYLIGHGGDGAFRMTETEILKAENLALWLNELQQTMQGLIIVIYEACHSGSFLSKLVPPSGKQRIVISSTAPTEVAQFLEGGVSFSYYFWNEVFVGTNIYQAYVMAKDGLETYGGTERVQNPQIDDDGNGIYEGKKDGELARGECVGKCIKTAGDIPTIKSISPDQILNGQTSATITVEVVSVERITRVWAVVYSPDFSATPGNPITDLPYFDFTWNGQTGKYEGTYNGFTVGGAYTVTVYAMNEATIISLPKTTKVEQVMSNQYTLTVTIAPSSEAGSVSKNPSKPTYTAGEAVTITANPNSGHTFSHWTGDASGSTNPITLTMDGNKTVTANFTQNQYTLILNTVPASSGSVVKNPDKPTYVYGEQVQLTATANPGYTFSHWTGDASGSTNPITLTMSENKTVIANFTQENAPDISVTPLAYDFGNVKVKKSKSASFKTQNNGKTNLTIATLIIGPDASMFTLTSGRGNKTIKPGKFWTIKVKFKPTSTGSKVSTLRMVSNDPDEPTIDIQLIGTGF